MSGVVVRTAAGDEDLSQILDLQRRNVEERLAPEERVPALGHMHARLRELSFGGRPLGELRYFIMGQVCVDKAFRGRGVFAGMYRKMRELYSAAYDMVVTEVARRNTRSIRAHEKVGFELLERYRDSSGEQWDLIVWDWLEPG